MSSYLFPVGKEIGNWVYSGIMIPSRVNSFKPGVLFMGHRQTE